MNNEEKILIMLTAMQAQMDGMQSEIKQIRSEMAGMQAEIKEIRSEIAGMQAKMTGMQTEMTGMQAEIRQVKSGMSEMNEKLDDLIEAHDVTRSCVNSILEWTDKVSAVHDFPIPRI